MTRAEKEVKELRDGIVESYEYLLEEDECGTEFAARVDKLIALSRALGRDYSGVVR